MIVELRVPPEIWPRRTDWVGRVVSVAVKPGDVVSKGDLVAEVEIEKAVLALEAQCNGRVLEVKVNSGDPVKPGTPIALIESAEVQSRS